VRGGLHVPGEKTHSKNHKNSRSSKSGVARSYEYSFQNDDSNDVIWKSYSVRTDLALEAQDLISRRTGQEVLESCLRRKKPVTPRLHGFGL